MRTLNTYTLLHPTPRIYKQYVNERFKHYKRNREILNSKITLLGLNFKIAKFDLFKIFWKPNCIYRMSYIYYNL